MKVIWRQYEMMFFTIITVIKLIGCFTDNGQLDSHAAQQMFIQHAGKAASFSMLKNVMLPQAGTLLLFYLCYLAVNFVVIAAVKIVAGGNKTAAVVKSATVMALGIAVIAFALALGVNVATYFGYPSWYNYGGFGDLAMFGYNDRPLTSLFTGYGHALAILSGFTLYACIREFYSTYLEKREGKKNYGIVIANRVTGFLVIYVSVPVLLATFNVLKGGFFESGFSNVYFGLLFPAFLTYITNIYFLFPANKGLNLLNTNFIIRLVLLTFLFSIAASKLFVFIDAGLIFLISWAVQLFVTTPVSWLVWRQQKDKILKLRGIEKELEASKANLQFLRSQINPHFLFNALNTLYGMALQEGSENTAKGIQKLGDMMRFMLHENSADFIAVDKEVEYLQNYISLQKLRTQASPNIVIQDNLGSQSCNYTVAPMLLIPLVENAFKHGISLSEKSWIKIDLHCDEKNINLRVSNSTHARSQNDPEKEQCGIGLKNIQERLILIYPGKHKLSFIQNSQEFTADLSLQF